MEKRVAKPTFNVEKELQELNDTLEQHVVDRTNQLAAANERLQQEISERERIIAELQLTQFCVDKASIEIFRISGEGKITFANELACRSLGYTYDELCSMTVFDIDPTFNLEVFRENRGIMRAMGTRTFETIHRRKDGSTFPVEVTANYLKYKDNEFGFSFVKDITKRKEAEEAVREKKEQLEELNRTLEMRVQEEVAKNREKDVILIQQNRQAALGEALEHIAHQWKQPLNTIGLLVQQLKLSWTLNELTKDVVDKTVVKTLDLLNHMAQTIDVFKDFYKPEKEMATFRLKESVEKALSFIEPTFKHPNIKVELDADPDLAVRGFSKEFVQVLLIVLTNSRDAFKERKTPNPHLAIKAFTEDKKAVVTITDNAGGIPVNTIGKIFDLYFTTKETRGGAGIGLYMAKSIIEKHMNGTLSVTNVNHGAQFRIEVENLQQQFNPQKASANC